MDTLLTIIGVAGGAIFYGRFYVQWIVSEWRAKSVIPVVFWYMSSIGSVMLLAFAVYTRSPVGALGQSFNMVIYARNLVHIRREAGALSVRSYVLLHSLAFIIVTVAVSFAAWTWYREYQVTREAPSQEMARTWLWLAVGVIGQGLFALRFLIQWVATERARRSVVPSAFWYCSAAAATLLCASFLERREWVFAVGTASTLLIYLRNIYLIYRNPEAERSATATEIET